MLALLLMMQEPTDNSNIIAAQNAAITAQVKTAEAKGDDATEADDNSPAARRPGADENVKNFDPNTPLYTEPNLCVVTNGQASAACGDANVGNNQPIMVNNDIFGLSAGTNQATCQMVETIRRDSDGNAKKVYATYCGDELGVADYHDRSTPTGSEMPVKPTDRTFGPQSTTAIDVK